MGSIEVSKWRHESVRVEVVPTTDAGSSQPSSARSSSDLSVSSDYTSIRPRSQDFHELYPSH